MDIAEIQAFIAVADFGSIKAAASALKVPRATVRRRIKSLEKRLDAEVVHSSPEGVRLTLVGSRVLTRARRLSREAELFLTEAAAKPTLSAIQVRTQPGLPPNLSAQAFGMVRTLLPQTQVGITFDPARPVDIIAQPGTPTGLDGWSHHTLMHLRERLVASPKYLARHGTPTDIETLRQHTLLSWRPPSRPSDRWPLLDGTLFEVTPALVHDDIHMLRMTAAAGLGIALLPDAEIDEGELDGGVVEPILTDLVGDTVPFTLSLHPRVADHPAFAATVALLAQVTGVL